MKSWILPVLLGLCCIPMVGQNLPETVILIKRSVDADGYPLEEKIHLTGEQATGFQLEAHLNTYQNIILFYQDKLEQEAAVQKGLSRPTGKGNLLSQVTQIKVMATDGTAWSYTFHPWEGFTVEEEVMGRNFFLVGDQPNNLLPSLYVGFENTSVTENYQLIWVDSGECPEEQFEEQLEIEKLNLQFLNEAGKMLLTRTISIDQNLQNEPSSARVVRIKTEIYKL